MRSVKRQFLLGIHTIAALLLYLCSSVCSKTVVPIAGDISKVVFDPAQNYYRVMGEIYISATADVRIPPGTILLFDAKVTFRIDGNCFVEGTTQQPVVFTSVNDTFLTTVSVKPTIFDWNGIYISQSAANVVFKNVIIKYAEHPLESNSPYLQLLSCTRVKTSDDFFMLNGTPLKVDAAVPFSEPLPLPPPPLPDTVKFGQDTLTPSPQASLLPEGTSWWKQKPVRWSLLGTGTAAVLITGGFTIGYFVNDDLFKKERAVANRENATEDNFPAMRRAADKADDALINRNVCKPAALISGILGTMALAGFGLTFIF